MTTCFSRALPWTRHLLLPACGAAVWLAPMTGHALSAWETGATWMVSVNDLGITGLTVAAGIVEVDGAGAPGIQYRVNPDPTNGWEGSFYFSNHFQGVTFRYFDDPNTADTNASPHATGVGLHYLGRYDPAWGSSPYRGNAIGCSTVGCYEANYFISNLLASNIPPADDVFSFAFTSDTSSTHVLTRWMDRMVDDTGKIFVQGVRSKAASQAFGGVHPAGMGIAFNIISIGAARSDFQAYGQSQYGPAWGFGTAKPELLADAISESTATGRGAGGAALLLDQARQQGASNGTDPRVIKAILLAGARKTFNWDKGVDGPADDHAVPLDQHAGAGILHGLNNYRIMSGGEAPPEGVYTGAAWNLETVDPGAPSNRYFIHVTATGNHLSAALTWHRHVVGMTATLQDLNLRLFAASGSVLLAEHDWSTSRVDSVEHLFCEAIPTGSYALVVDASLASLPETYALAWQFTTDGILHPGDSDGDGLPDAFEENHFGDIFLYDGTNDPDTDGMNNMEEYIADTVPANSGSVQTVHLSMQTNADMNIFFPSSTARVYSVQYQDPPAAGLLAWSNTAAAFSGSGGLTNWIDDGSETGGHPSQSTARLYRVQVRLP